MRCIISLLYFSKELYMFQTYLLSIIRSLNTAFIAKGICHTSYVACLLARSGNTTSMTNTCCSEYSIKTPDDGQQICPKHVEFFTKIKLRNSASHLTFIIRMCLRYFALQFTNRLSWTEGI